MLLIAFILPTGDLGYLNRSAPNLDMQKLLEVHSLDEVDRTLSLSTPPDMLGINNRDLSDFSMSLSNTSELLSYEWLELIRENGSLVDAESGTETAEDVTTPKFSFNSFSLTSGCVVCAGEKRRKRMM